MKKILIIGNGAREHVIAETFLKSSHDVEIFVYGSAKNPGLLVLSTDYEVGKLNDLDTIRDFAKRIEPTFAFVGPENPIADGVTDALAEIGVKSASPSRIAGEIESSKSFTRDLVAKYNIPGNPAFKVFTDKEGLEEYMHQELGGNYVVKADGLMGGKGVKVSGDHLETVADGVSYASECIDAAGKVVVEEKFVGQEFSLMSFVDGENVVSMPAVQDHKRAYDGDKGPNTGGMGTYSDANHSLPFLQPSDIEAAHEINVQVAKAFYEQTGTMYKGILYGGFIACKDKVGLIEYNVRFGDPEAMNVLPLLKTDFVDICEAIIAGTLDELIIEFENKATVCKYIVPEGYPGSPVKGEKIEVGEIAEGVKTYYASVDQREDGLYLGGSRAVAFVGISDTLDEAASLATSAMDSVTGPVFYRKDIGTKALLDKRVEMMKELRG